MNRTKGEWDGNLRPITLRGIEKRRRGLRAAAYKLKSKLRRLSIQELKDLRERARPIADRLTVLKQLEAGPAGGSFALYAHYSRRRSVSRMVQKQLQMLAEAGFRVLFVSMSPIDAAAQAELETVVETIVVRRSFGRDFGAWRDLWMQWHGALSGASEVLLVNDSILGPIRPFASLIEGLRASEGVSGLVDSADKLRHLQSFFLLFRGAESVGMLDRFFDQLQLSFEKERMIERGELGLARFIKASGLRCQVAFGYEQAEELALEDQVTMETLLAAYPALFLGELPKPGDDVAWRRLRTHVRVKLWQIALNPTHYFWRVLVEKMGFPYIKTELLVANPAAMPDVMEWPDLIGPDSPVTANEIREHLESVA